MLKKKIFHKKKSFINRNFYLLFALFLFIIFIYYFFFMQKSFYFNIPVNVNFFYTIPDDREGKSIDNQEKKTMHLSYINKDNIDLVVDPNLKFSIQLYVSDNYKSIFNYKSKLLSADESIFLPEDIYMAILNYDQTSEYFLLFKNFSTRKNAFDYCKKYSYYLDECLIVNVKNLD
jgi:hypothetical protein